MYKILDSSHRLSAQQPPNAALQLVLWFVERKAPPSSRWNHLSQFQYISVNRSVDRQEARGNLMPRSYDIPKWLSNDPTVAALYFKFIEVNSGRVCLLPYSTSRRWIHQVFRKPAATVLSSFPENIVSSYQ